MDTPMKVTLSTGNVFEDLEFENPDSMLLKLDMARTIRDIVKRSGMAQREIAKKLRIQQPHVSELVNLRLARFSTDKLLQMFIHLGFDLVISAKPAEQRPSMSFTTVSHSRIQASRLKMQSIQKTIRKETLKLNWNSATFVCEEVESPDFEAFSFNTRFNPVVSMGISAEVPQTLTGSC